MSGKVDVKIPLESFSLAAAECAICKKALELAGECGGGVGMAAAFMHCSEKRVRRIMRKHKLIEPALPQGSDSQRGTLN